MPAFVELVIVVVIAALCALIARILRQPLMVGYIAAGIVIGPHVLNVVTSTEQLELFSKIGITVLLFIVGLNLNPKVIKEVGKASLITGVGQVVVTSLVGFGIALGLGIDRIAAIYVAIALTFSSTIIILKLLTDRGDVHKLYGKVAIGFLLVQDIIATLILMLVPVVTGRGENGMVLSLMIILLKGGWILFGLYLISEWVIPKAAKFLAQSTELLFLCSLAWGLGFATLFYYAGFSIEIGALIAGVVLSLTPFADEVGSRLKPLRDFFIVLFFILLGAHMKLDTLPQILVPALVFSLYVLIGNPIIMIILMSLLGYKRKTGFMAGLTVAQISEFSLILGTLGFNLGHLDQSVLSLLTLVGLITIAGSTYLILYADKVYLRVEPLLKLLTFQNGAQKETKDTLDTPEILLFGYDRVGNDFVRAFKKLGDSFLVIDFNPDSIDRLQNAGIPYKFGDAEDGEFLEELLLEKVKLVVSTLPEFSTNKLLIKRIRHLNSRAVIITISHNSKEAIQLYEEGASYVVMPHYLGASFATKLIGKFKFDVSAYKKERQIHLTDLEKQM